MRDWFQQVRGARALINGTDVRWGVEVLLKQIYSSISQQPKEEIDLVLRGFARVKGELGPFYVARVLDEEGEPIGYRAMVGVDLLLNPEQKRTFEELSDSFRFKEAVRVYAKRDQATRDFLKKCIEIGILRQPAWGQYEKIVPSGESGGKR